MGWWNLISNIGNAEGIREAMRMSFDKHYSLGQRKTADTPLAIALFGAMGSRYRTRGLPADGEAETAIWGDVVPFLCLDKNTAREALAEYVVYKERPREARIAWLTQIVQKGHRASLGKEGFRELGEMAQANGVPWLLLVEGRGEEYFW